MSRIDAMTGLVAEIPVLKREIADLKAKVNQEEDQTESSDDTDATLASKEKEEDSLDEDYFPVYRSKGPINHAAATLNRGNMNNHCVPDFEIEMDDDEYPIPTSSGLTRLKNPFEPDDDIMELFWQNGQVVMQSQNQRSVKKQPPAGPSTAREIRSSQPTAENQHLFMQEDELTSWLHYPFVDENPLDQNFYADLLFQPPTTVNNNSAMQTPVRTSQITDLRQPPRSVAPLPPILPAGRTEQVQTRIQNFAYFSKHNVRLRPGPSSLKTKARESTVVDSSITPNAAADSMASETERNTAEPTDKDGGRGSMSNAGKAAASAGGCTRGKEVTKCEITVSCSSGRAEPAHRTAAEDRKRKGREPDDSECQSEDVDFESADAKKQVRGSTSTKRSRAAERRRDRINEKMKALQELIPRCNKSDKASMLDEAIEYLKSLQFQVQMMSMGCGMVPMMFPGIQQYMPPMGMGIGMGMGMNRPLMPFPNILAGSSLPAATAAAHLGPRIPMPPFHMPHVPAPDSSRMQAPQQSDHMLTSPGTSNPNQSRIPYFTDLYQQYLGPQQIQKPTQSQAINQGGQDNPENHQSEGI
ncbi:hypothetical protein L6164_033529 [Bauhinia variegata]|uniref:Uncharacterized protein n=1 Tax=Bauhinia variegata TaxID=167791 RepID=A0ACB9KS09_BAUVA|nr:hypothetical protein L6164_033529 [Bauhinia variegata]